MEMTLPFPGYVPIVPRFHRQLFATDVQGRPAEDQYVHIHSNRLAIVGVASTHRMLQDPSTTVTSVDFSSGGRARHNLADIHVRGKSKKGALRLDAHSFLCEVTCSDGSKYQLRACMGGSLLEVNALLLERPNLIKEKPDTEGYLAIIKAPQNDPTRVTGHLKSLEEYRLLRNLNRDSSSSAESAT